MSPAQHLLARVWAPAVAVHASPEAQALCTTANGLTLAELLRPFGELSQLNGTQGVPVRTSAERPLRLHSWRIRFYEAETMRQPAPEAADAHLRRVLEAAAQGVGELEVLEEEELMQQVRAGADTAPWFAAYRSEFLRSLAFADHEALDHPAALLLALPANQGGDLVGAFRALHAAAAAAVPALASGLAEPGLAMHYVLLHDAAGMGPSALDGLQNKLHYLTSALGGSVQLLTVNSAAAGSPAGSPRPAGDPRRWAAALGACIEGGGAGEPAARQQVQAGGLGCALSRSDMQGLASYVHEMAVRSLIPHMEGRVRSLSAQVASARRGLRNQLRSFLWRKSSGSFGAAAASAMGSLLDAGGPPSPQQQQPGTGTSGSGAAPAAPQYPTSTVEAQMRQLADLALMLGDYETAASTLRLLASDFKGDKAYKHYAGVQEALAAAVVLSGGPPADAAAHYKEALHRYHQIAQRDPGARAEVTRYATRAAMLLAAHMGPLGQSGDASWACIKASYAESDLRAGLLLEQASLALLAASLPQRRKSAFQLVLAGLRYNLCGQKGLAQHAYKQVLGAYSGRGWGLIEEHLHDVLGKQSREAGDQPATMQHFMAMLRCEANSLQCQRLYLSQFMDAAAAAAAQLGYSPTLELLLPVINLERVGLQYDGQTCYGNVEARQVAAEAWRPLEAAVQQPSAAADGPAATWLDGGSRTSVADWGSGAAAAAHTCYVGEAVGLDVELTNPLQIDLALTHLRLACTFQPSSGGSEEEAAAASSGDGCGSSSDGQLRQEQRQQGSPNFQAREESITLRAGERMVVHLRAVPLRPGSLEVGGVAWTLGGVAQGLQRFRIPRPRPRKPGTSRVMLDVERPPSGGVTLTVLPPMPRLEVAVEGLEPTLLAGQLVRASLRLRNTGSMTLQSLAMATDAAGIYLGSGGSSCNSSSSSPSAGGSSGARASSSSDEQAAAEVTCKQRQGVAMFSLPPHLRLAVGQELMLPIWFRPARPGPVRFNQVWYYEPVVRLDTLRYRIVRSSYTVVALPSLTLSAGALAGAPGVHPGAALLQVHAGNGQSQESFRLMRLSCPDGAWLLHDLQQQGPVQHAISGSNCSGSNARGSSSSTVLDMLVEPESSATLHFSLRPLPPGGAPTSAVQGAELHLYQQGQPGAVGSVTLQAQQQRRQWQQQHQQQAERRRAAAVAASSTAAAHHLEGELSRPLDLLLQWETTGKRGAPRRQGYQVLYHQRVQVGAPIHAQLVGPRMPLRHDFAASRFCVVDLMLRLHNTLGAPAAVCIEAGKEVGGRSSVLGQATWAEAAISKAAADGGSPTRGGRPAAAGAAPPMQSHVWCGRTRLTLPSVQAGQTVEVPLQVAVLMPGQLSLGDYRVSWQYTSAPQLTGSAAGVPCMVAVYGV